VVCASRRERIYPPQLQLSGSPAYGSHARTQSDALRAADSLFEPHYPRRSFIENSIEFSDVQVLFDTGMSLVCLVDGMRVRVPSHLMQSGTEVRSNGDRGRLVIPRSLAVSVGLA